MPSPPKRSQRPQWLAILSILAALAGCVAPPYQPTTELRAKIKGTIYHIDATTHLPIVDLKGHPKTGVVSIFITSVDGRNVSAADAALQMKNGMPIDTGMHKLGILVLAEGFKDAVNGATPGKFYFIFNPGKTYRLEPPRYEQGDDKTAYMRLYLETPFGEELANPVPVEYKINTPSWWKR
jgi:hypothetical protein